MTERLDLNSHSTSFYPNPRYRDLDKKEEVMDTMHDYKDTDSRNEPRISPLEALPTSGIVIRGSQMKEPNNDFQPGINATNNKGAAVSAETRYTEITKDKPIRLQVKVLIPVKEHPRFNFVGKLLGPKGNSLKRLQEETMTKMAILGRGSMRDKAKEEELRKQSDPKHSHLTEDLHIEVNAFAPPAEAYGRISHALSEIKKFLVPDDNDEIRQTQLQELAYINGSAPTTGAPGRGRGRGGAPPPPLGGPSPARTARAGLLATPPPAPRAITTRPGAAGPLPGRGVLPPSRPSPARVPPPLPRVATYRTAVAETRSYEDDYDYQEPYEQRYAEEESDPQYYEYAHTGAVEPYDAGYNADETHYAGGITILDNALLADYELIRDFKSIGLYDVQHYNLFQDYYMIGGDSMTGELQNCDIVKDDDNVGKEYNLFEDFDNFNFVNLFFSSTV